MKKLRLKESELVNLINRVINEQFPGPRWQCEPTPPNGKCNCIMVVTNAGAQMENNQFGSKEECENNLTLRDGTRNCCSGPVTKDDLKKHPKEPTTKRRVRPLGPGHIVPFTPSSGVLAESQHGSSYMAKKQLWSIADKAEDMAKRLPDNTQLEDWMESHIAKADSMMDSVYDSFDYDNQMDIPGFEGTMDALDNLTINEDKFWKEVKIKDKCKTFPYCSEGAVDSPLEYPGRKKKRSKRKKSSKNKYHNIGKWISENEINHLIKRVINEQLICDPTTMCQKDCSVLVPQAWFTMADTKPCNWINNRFNVFNQRHISMLEDGMCTTCQYKRVMCKYTYLRDLKIQNGC